MSILGEGCSTRPTVANLRITPPLKVIARTAVLDAIRDMFDVTPAEIRGPSRKYHICQPRHVFTYLARHDLKLTYSQIGAFLGGRDHCTIIRSIKRADLFLREEIEAVRDRIRAGRGS